MSDFVTITSQDTIIFEVANRMKIRADKGLQTYGVTMDRKDLTNEQ